MLCTSVAELRERRAVDRVSALPRLELGRVSPVPRRLAPAFLEDVVVGPHQGLAAEQVVDPRELVASPR